MAHIKQKLKGEFDMMDLGNMKKILGIRVERDRAKGTLKISQGPYIDIILTQFQMQNANPVSTPLNKSAKLTPNIKLMINVPYAKAIGLLMYMALGTQPDLAFPIQHLSQFTTSFGPEQWTAVKHVFRYLKGTRNGTITFKQECYTPCNTRTPTHASPQPTLLL